MKKRFLILFAAISAFLIYAGTPSADCATVREVVCAYIDHMATIKWTPAKGFASCNDISKVYRAGKVYHGMPYTKNNVQNLRVFRENLDKSAVPKYTGATSADKYVGTDSAGAIYSAWSEIGANIKFKDEKDMFPALGKGVLAVGGYDFKWNSSSTYDIASAEKEAVMLESYAMLRNGDALFKYIPNGSKGSLMAMEINVIKTSSGAIDGQKSNVLVVGQNVFESMASTTTWHYYKKYTFSELLSEGYLPITCAELKSSDSTLLAPIIYVSEFEGGKRVTITDKNKDTVVYYTTDGTTPSQHSTKYNGNITVTTSSTINAIAISDTAKSPVASRIVGVTESSAPKLNIADFIAGKMVAAEVDDPDTAVYYSIDGTAFEKYSSPFIADRKCSVVCYAVKTGCRRSKMIQTSINIKTVAPPVVKSIENTAGGKRVTVASGTPNAVFYYTVDGTEPYESSKSFKDSLVIGSSCTLRLRAMKSGMGVSDIISVDIELSKIQPPEIISTDIIGGKKITLKCQTAGSRIYYTTNGSMPKPTGQPYTEPFFVSDTCTVTAMAVIDGGQPAKAEKQIKISQVSVPIIKVDSDFKVTLSCKTSGALIYYTVDGTYPHMLSNKYVGSFNVSKGTTVRAFAVRNGMKLSDTVSAKAKGALTTESTIVLSDYNYPTSLDFGENYEIKGKIKSNYKILSVSLGIYDDAGQLLSSGVMYPNSKNADISRINGTVDFSKSASGKNYYRITVTDMQGTKRLLNKQFTVAQPGEDVSRLSLSDGIFPTVLMHNEDFNINGRITSNYDLRNIVIGIFDTKNKAVSVFKCNPMSNSFCLSAISDKLDFSSLESGTYYLRITVTDKAVKKTLINRAFNVQKEIGKSGITLKNQAFPEILEQGGKFEIKGKLISDRIIKYAVVELFEHESVTVFSKKVRINSTDYDISLLAEYLRFEYLDTGIYKLRITAADAEKEYRLTNKEFIITDSTDCHMMNIAKLYTFDYRDTVCTIDGKDYSVASCGSFAACTAMLKNHLDIEGKTVSPDDVLEKAYENGIFTGKIPSLRQILELCYRYYNMDTKITDDERDMIDAIKQNVPAIAHIKTGIYGNRTEYVVIKGYSVSENGEYIYINSPSSPILSSNAIKLSDFMKMLDNKAFLLVYS